MRSASHRRPAETPFAAHSRPDEVTDPEEPPRPVTPQERVAARLAAQAAAAAAAAQRAPARAVRPIRAGLALFAAAIALCLGAYLAATVPGPWFPRASPVSWGPGDFGLARGTGAVRGGALVITGVDSSETALVSIKTDIRSTDYRSVAWDTANIPSNADVQMLWRSDYAPSKLNSTPATVVSGRVQPVDVSAQPGWLGRINGIALVIRTPLAQPVSVSRVTAKPMGALDLLRDRAREWLAYEPWTGTSINVVAGGAGVQDLPLPPLLAVAAVLAMLASLLLLRRSPRRWAFPLAVGAIFVAAWLVADLRWQWNLARQVADTRSRYAGKDWRARHLAAEDGPLFAFIEGVRAKLPAEPARVFMVAEAHYFRDRGAYHLYPHNVFFNPYADTVPPTSALRPGDYVVVYHRRGIQYDAAQQRVRFPDGSTVGAEVLLAERGAALMRIR